MNKQINAIRDELENLKKTEEFKKTSDKLKANLARQLGVKDLEKSGIKLESRLPIPLTEVIKKMSGSDEEKIKRLKTLTLPLESILNAANVRDIKTLLEGKDVSFRLDDLYLTIEDIYRWQNLWDDDDYKYTNVYNYANW